MGLVRRLVGTTQWLRISSHLVLFCSCCSKVGMLLGTTDWPCGLDVCGPCFPLFGGDGGGLAACSPLLGSLHCQSLSPRRVLPGQWQSPGNWAGSSGGQRLICQVLVNCQLSLASCQPSVEARTFCLLNDERLIEISTTSLP